MIRVSQTFLNLSLFLKKEDDCLKYFKNNNHFNKKNNLKA